MNRAHEWTRRARGCEAFIRRLADRGMCPCYRKAINAVHQPCDREAAIMFRSRTPRREHRVPKTGGLEIRRSTHSLCSVWSTTASADGDLTRLLIYISVPV